jgi:virginiamycin B lyase
VRRPTLLAMLALALPASASAQGITEFPLPAGADPTFITTGYDGRLWFPMNGAGQIGRIGTDGALRQPSLPSQPNPIDITAGPDGAMTWTSPGTIQRRTPTGVLSSTPAGSISTAYAVASTAETVWWTLIQGSMFGNSATLAETAIPFSGSTSFAGVAPSGSSSPKLTDITVAPDGKLWLTLYDAAVFKRTATGSPELQIDLAAGSLPYRITPGPEGAMWFTEYGADRIGRITNAGVVTEFDLPREGVGPNDIVAGPDGALWFTEYKAAGNAIGRITTTGRVTEYPIPTPNSQPWGIAVGADGKIWFTEYGSDKIGRLDPARAVPIGGGGGGPGGGGPGADRTKPAFQGRVTISRKRFTVGRAPTPFTAAQAVRSGTEFRFSLSEPARVTVKIERKLRGRRVRGRCRAGARTGRRCTLWRSAGRSLTRQGLQGANSIAFSGRLGRKALAVGSYRALITAADAARNRSRTAKLGFTIVRKRR